MVGVGEEDLKKKGKAQLISTQNTIKRKLSFTQRFFGSPTDV